MVALRRVWNCFSLAFFWITIYINIFLTDPFFFLFRIKISFVFFLILFFHLCRRYMFVLDINFFWTLLTFLDRKFWGILPTKFVTLKCSKLQEEFCSASYHLLICDSRTSWRACTDINARFDWMDIPRLYILDCLLHIVAVKCWRTSFNTYNHQCLHGLPIILS